MGLRLQDPVPEWISHIALVQDGRVKTGEKKTILQELNDSGAKEASHSTSPVHNAGLESNAKVLVNMQNVNVRYHERHVSQLSFHTQFTTNSVQVLKNINWTIRSGDRWHLQGANGEFFKQKYDSRVSSLHRLRQNHSPIHTDRRPSTVLHPTRPNVHSNALRLTTPCTSDAHPPRASRRRLSRIIQRLAART